METQNIGDAKYWRRKILRLYVYVWGCRDVIFCVSYLDFVVVLGDMGNQKYKNQYRIESTRLRYWDYGANAAYFITICTKNKENYFGDIDDDEMKHSDIGVLAEKYWLEIPEHFSFVKLDLFVIMPNHIHGIVVIDKPEKQNARVLGDAKYCVSTNRFGVQSGNLGSIVRGYKVGVTKHARVCCPSFAWQPRYWDHIIRDENEYNRISKYIKINPKKWEIDKLNSDSQHAVKETPNEYSSNISIYM